MTQNIPSKDDLLSQIPTCPVCGAKPRYGHLHKWDGDDSHIQFTCGGVVFWARDDREIHGKPGQFERPAHWRMRVACPTPTLNALKEAP